MRLLRSTLAAALTAYGAAAIAVLLAISVLRDGTVATYTAALVSFWWLLPAPALLVAALVLRTWRTAVVLLVPALVWMLVHGPPLGPPARGPGDLRVAAFNIEPGTGVGHVRALVDEQHPDVLLMQEVGPDARAPLADALPDHPHRWYAPVADAERGGGGTAVASRYPITAVEPVTGLPRGARASALLTLDVEGRAVRVLSLHLASPCFGCGPEQAAANPAGGTARAARVRVAEARRYAEVVRPLLDAGERVVVGGDLNSAELNEPVPLLVGAGLADAHRRAGTGPGLTREPGPGLARIDVVLVGGLRAVRTTEGSPGRSRHSPVVADLAWVE